MKLYQTLQNSVFYYVYSARVKLEALSCVSNSDLPVERHCIILLPVMSNTSTTRSKSKMTKERDIKDDGASVRDVDAFRLDIIEAFKDPSVAEQMATAFAPYLERIANKMCEKLDTKVKIMTEQLQVRDKKIQALENTVKTLQLKFDDQEQYSRCESLRITGIPEIENENTDRLVMALCNDTLKLDPRYKIKILRGPMDLVMLAKVTGLFWQNLLHTKFVTMLSGQEPT